MTYLHHVGLLEKLADNVAGVYVSNDVDAHCEAVLHGAELSAELMSAVDRIRAALNSAVEKGGTGAMELGRKFLDKIFGDQAQLQRQCELFAASMVVSTVRLRAVLRDRDVPLYWFRLASLTHAGVLTTALSGLTKTADFMAWSIRELGASYTWYSVLDAAVAPRLGIGMD